LPEAPDGALWRVAFGDFDVTVVVLEFEEAAWGCVAFLLVFNVSRGW
jgi:hypothetical protein